MRYLFLLLSLFAVAPAYAGLFNDEEARKQIQQLEMTVQQLTQQLTQKIEEDQKLQTKSLLDLQAQIDTLSAELRKFRGLNEEVSRGLQDAEKRTKDFYVDIDTRLRRFEIVGNPGGDTAASGVPPADPNDPVAENRAYETAYGLYKGESLSVAAQAFQDFIKKYPDSVYKANATYWMGESLFALKDFNGALLAYQNLLKILPDSPRAAEVLLNLYQCQIELKQVVPAKATYKQLISKYPASDAAAKAKMLNSKAN